MDVKHEMARDAAMATAKAAPPVAVSAATVVGGMSLNEWVLIATLIYLVLQIGYLAWRWARDFIKARREAV